MLENIHSKSLLQIMHSGPFFFHSLGEMQMASTYHLEPADKEGKQSDCTYMPALPTLNLSLEAHLSAAASETHGLELAKMKFML